MTNSKNNTREVLKNIPSIDEVIRKFSDNFSLIPIDFLKLKINNELNKIRSEFKEGLSVSNPKDYINNRILKLVEDNPSDTIILMPIIQRTMRLVMPLTEMISEHEKLIPQSIPVPSQKPSPIQDK